MYSEQNHPETFKNSPHWLVNTMGMLYVPTNYPATASRLKIALITRKKVLPLTKPDVSTINAEVF